MRSIGAALLAVGGLCVGVALGFAVADKPDSTAPGPVDVGFAQDMAVHHDQAVTMALAALDHASDPRIAVHAKQILVDQAAERGMLQGWLAEWGKPQLPAGQPMTWMGKSHGRHQDRLGVMPGMATPAQLERLGQLDGSAFDREFLVLMTRHHEGGMAMAKYAASHARLSNVRSAAALMLKKQAQEVSAFRRFLKGAGGST